LPALGKQPNGARADGPGGFTFTDSSLRIIEADSIWRWLRGHMQTLSVVGIKTIDAHRDLGETVERHVIGIHIQVRRVTEHKRDFVQANLRWRLSHCRLTGNL